MTKGSRERAEHHAGRGPAEIPRWRAPMRTRASVFVAVSTLFITLLPSVANSAAELRPSAARPTYLDAKAPIGRRVEDLLSRMTLEEKVGQMTQAERGALSPPAGNASMVATLRLGSVLSGGGSTPTPNTPEAWVN